MTALTSGGQLVGATKAAMGPRPDPPADELEPTDQALVRASMEGSTGAFEELYRRHAPAAWRVAQAVSRNPDDASDAVAEAFTRVFQALPSGRLGPDLNFRPYLLAATRNAAIDGIRRSSRSRPTDEIECFDGHAPGSGPSERLMVGEDRQKMAEAFAALPERWRSVLWMTEVEEMPARDVAKLLGLSANGVAQLAVRARAGLRDRYLQAHVRNHARPTCARAVEHLGAYVGGGLSPRDIAKVDQHLAGCTECRERLVEVEEINSALRRIALPVPFGLGAAALTRFRANLLSTAAGATRRALPATDGLRRAVGAAAGVGAIVVGFGGLAFLGPAESPSASGRSVEARAEHSVKAPDGAPTASAAAPSAERTAKPEPAAAPTSSAPTLPKLAVPPLPAVTVAVPPLPVQATAGVGPLEVGVGRCTGATVGSVTVGCPPPPPTGTTAPVQVDGVVSLGAG